MGFTAAGISPTTVTTAAEGAQAPLGFRLTVPQGDNGMAEYVYIKSAGDIKVGNICGQSGVVPYTATLATATLEANKVYGVAQVDIPSGSFGFVLARGFCPKIATFSTSVPAAGDQILSGQVSSADGFALANDLGNEAKVAGDLGHLLTVGAADTTVGTFNYGTAMIDCRG